MEWLALLCLPRTLRSFLLCLSSSILLSIAGSPGLPIFSQKSILVNTGALGGGWAWMSGSTYPTPGPPILSSMLSSSESSPTRRAPHPSDVAAPRSIQQDVIGGVDHACLSASYRTLRKQAVYGRGVQPTTDQLDAGLNDLLDRPHGADGGDRQGGEVRHDTVLPVARVQEMWPARWSRIH